MYLQNDNIFLMVDYSVTLKMYVELSLGSEYT